MRANLKQGGVEPGAVLRPVLGADYPHSNNLIMSLMNGQPGCPKINSGSVDVRDVAELHLRAMTDPAANGERLLATSGASMDMVEVAEVCAGAWATRPGLSRRASCPTG